MFRGSPNRTVRPVSASMLATVMLSGRRPQRPRPDPLVIACANYSSTRRRPIGRRRVACFAAEKDYAKGVTQRMAYVSLADVRRHGLCPRSQCSSSACSRKLWYCLRRILARIHRLTIGRLRAEIQPLTAQDFMRFLLRWQHLDQPELRGRGGLLKSISLLQGYEAPASAWEHVLITSGPRSSTGYSIQIRRAVVERSRIYITVREVDRPGHAKLTYPYRLLVFRDLGKPVHVHWEGRS